MVKKKVEGLSGCRVIMVVRLSGYHDENQP